MITGLRVSTDKVLRNAAAEQFLTVPAPDPTNGGQRFYRALWQSESDRRSGFLPIGRKAGLVGETVCVQPSPSTRPRRRSSAAGPAPEAVPSRSNFATARASELGGLP